MGLTVGDAKTQLEGLGFKVKESSVIDETRADGLVVEQQPAAGTPNAGEVTGTSRERPEIRFLSQFTPVTRSGAGTGGEARKGNAQVYNRWIEFDQSYGSTYISFDLSRGYRSLTRSRPYSTTTQMIRRKQRSRFLETERLLGEAEAVFRSNISGSTWT